MTEKTVPTVYVTQEVRGRNILSATEYGNISVLLPHGNLFTFNNDEVIKVLQEGLDLFTVKDYLLLMGDPGSIAAAAMIASSKTGGYVNLLKWDKELKHYYPTTIDIRRNNGSI